MSRRKTELFSLSFLDMLSGALGAVIFLFIITPKGGAPAAKTHQVAASIDTLHNQIFGGLHDSLSTKSIGDTLLVLIKGFEKMPTIEDCPECPPPMECPPRRKCPECPECPECPGLPSANDVATASGTNPGRQPGQSKPPPSPPVNTSRPGTGQGDNDYKGDPPAVPCNVSFEINWKDMGDNVDLIVCKDGNCVNGRKKKHKDIGQWSSGITPTSIFGTDFRTSQEAVRQFREIIPGKYTLKALFKESEKNNPKVDISGLIYTKTLEGEQKGERFSKTLQRDGKGVNLGTVVLRADGTFTFNKQ